MNFNIYTVASWVQPTTVSSRTIGANMFEMIDVLRHLSSRSCRLCACIFAAISSACDCAVNAQSIQTDERAANSHAGVPTAYFILIVPRSAYKVFKNGRVALIPLREIERATRNAVCSLDDCFSTHADRATCPSCTTSFAFVPCASKRFPLSATHCPRYSSRCSSIHAPLFAYFEEDFTPKIRASPLFV